MFDFLNTSWFHSSFGEQAGCGVGMWHSIKQPRNSGSKYKTFLRGSLPLAFSGSVRSGFQEQHECIPLSATATETQGTDMHSPMMSFPRFGRALVTGHGSFNCCFIIINPNYQGFFSTNPLEESEMTRPSHCSWGFPLMQILHWPGLLRKPWLRSLPMARSGWDQEHDLDLVFL